MTKSFSLREDWVDLIKGIMICFVILGHCITVTGAKGKLAENILVLIYTVHMPAFFILSGYVLKINKTVRQFLKSKTKLITSYFAFMLIDTILPIFLREYSFGDAIADIKSNWVDILLMTTKSRYSSLWFLPVVVVALLIAFLLEKYINQKKWIISISILLILTNQIWYLTKLESFLGIREAFIAQFYIILGYELKDYIKKLALKANSIFCILLFTLWVYMTAEWMHFGLKIVNYWNSNVAPFTWAFLIAVIGNCFFVCLAGIWRNNNGFLYKSLISLGRITVYIYGIHYAFLVSEV